MKFDINFVEKNYFSFTHLSKLGLAVFLISLLSLVFFIGAYQTRLSQQKANGLTATLQQKILPPHENTVLHYSDEALKQVSTIVTELAMPWDALLDGLEQIELDHLTLLSLAPNFKNKTVVLTGQSKNMQTVLDYVEKLENLPMLSEVYLQKHTVEQAIPTQPISFTIVAKWQS